MKLQTFKSCQGSFTFESDVEPQTTTNVQVDKPLDSIYEEQTESNRVFAQEQPTIVHKISPKVRQKLQIVHVAAKLHSKYGPFSNVISRELWSDVVDGIEESLNQSQSKIKASNFSLQTDRNKRNFMFRS